MLVISVWSFTHAVVCPANIVSVILRCCFTVHNYFTMHNSKGDAGEGVASSLSSQLTCSSAMENDEEGFMGRFWVDCRLFWQQLVINALIALRKGNQWDWLELHKLSKTKAPRPRCGSCRLSSFLVFSLCLVASHSDTPPRTWGILRVATLSDFDRTSSWSPASHRRLVMAGTGSSACVPTPCCQCERRMWRGRRRGRSAGSLGE